MIDMQLARRFMIKTIKDVLYLKECIYKDGFTSVQAEMKLDTIQEGLTLLTYILHMDEIDLINIDDKPHKA